MSLLPKDFNVASLAKTNVADIPVKTLKPVCKSVEATIPDLMTKHDYYERVLKHEVPLSQCVSINELPKKFELVPPTDNFNEAERRQFWLAYSNRPKQFGQTAATLHRRSAGTCVQYYYANKDKIDFHVANRAYARIQLAAAKSAKKNLSAIKEEPAREEEDKEDATLNTPAEIQNCSRPIAAKNLTREERQQHLTALKSQRAARSRKRAAEQTSGDSGFAPSASAHVQAQPEATEPSSKKIKTEASEPETKPRLMVTFKYRTSRETSIPRYSTPSVQDTPTPKDSVAEPRASPATLEPASQAVPSEHLNSKRLDPEPPASPIVAKPSGTETPEASMEEAPFSGDFLNEYSLVTADRDELENVKIPQRKPRAMPKSDAGEKSKGGEKKEASFQRFYAKDAADNEELRALLSQIPSFEELEKTPVPKPAPEVWYRGYVVKYIDGKFGFFRVIPAPKFEGPEPEDATDTQSNDNAGSAGSSLTPEHSQESRSVSPSPSPSSPFSNTLGSPNTPDSPQSVVESEEKPQPDLVPGFSEPCKVCGRDVHSTLSHVNKFRTNLYIQTKMPQGLVLLDILLAEEKRSAAAEKTEQCGLCHLFGHTFAQHKTWAKALQVKLEKTAGRKCKNWENSLFELCVLESTQEYLEGAQVGRTPGPS